MCGIACIVALRGNGDIAACVDRMNSVVRHRGPDAQGSAIVGQVGLGHTRLAIIDLTYAGCQPRSRGGHHITFNGEIYNYRELRSDLVAKGYAFRTASDTEVLLTALEHWGIEALERLRGMFAFAWLDADAGVLYLARDPFGKKPLAWQRTGDYFCAASEPKQIFEALGCVPSANLEVALRFLERGLLNIDDNTFFEGVQFLPAGSYGRLDLSSGDFSVTRWYDLKSRIRPHRPPLAQAHERVRELLIQAVRRRFVADVPVGIGLSGGIDSSVIVSLSASLQRDAPLRTISTFSPRKGYDERAFSRAVNEKFGIDAIEVEAQFDRIWDPEFFREAAYYREQPILSGSYFNQYLLFKAARENNLIVMLGGQGADEYFGGYGEFWFASQIEALKSGRLAEFWAGIGVRAESLSLPASMVLRRFVRSLMLPARPRKTSVDWRRVPSAISLAPPPGDYLSLSIDEIVRTSVPYQVFSEDRNSMRWSVEARLPFLDIDLVEYVLGLPTVMKCHRGVQKSLLRETVPELPTIVSQRKDKVGFASPDAESLSAHADSVRSDLQDSLSRMTRIVNGDVVLSAFDQMVRSQTCYDPLFYRIMALDGWVRAFGREL